MRPDVSGPESSLAAGGEWTKGMGEGSALLALAMGRSGCFESCGGGLGADAGVSQVRGRCGAGGSLCQGWGTDQEAGLEGSEPSLYGDQMGPRSLLRAPGSSSRGQGQGVEQQVSRVVSAGHSRCLSNRKHRETEGGEMTRPGGVLCGIPVTFRQWQSREPPTQRCLRRAGMRGGLLEGTPHVCLVQNLVPAGYQDWGRWRYLQSGDGTGGALPLGVSLLRCGSWEQVFSGSLRRGRGKDEREPGAGPLPGFGRTRARGSSGR